MVQVDAAGIAGYERMAAWCDLLDEINVFPVADADTGRNLRISLAPFKQAAGSSQDRVRRFLGAATGNSGNIAAAFFSVFWPQARNGGLAAAAGAGARSARQSIETPAPGTMLCIFDALAAALAEQGDPRQPRDLPPLVDALVQAVAATAETLPEMRRHGVVDAGALGMFLFFEAFLAAVVGASGDLRWPPDLFPGRLRRREVPGERAAQGACINAWVRDSRDPAALARQVAGLGQNLVATVSGRDVKLHLHARHPDRVARELRRFGDLADWRVDPLAQAPRPPRSRVHLMTDAAGSLTAAAARDLGITLLDSYVVLADAARPETLVDPAQVYAALGRGERVTTAQASRFERRERYASVVGRFERVLYLCVGSVYTGNHGAALEWCRDHDAGDRMLVVDSGAASGRLGLMAIALARYGARDPGIEAMGRYAATLIRDCEELVFLDTLKFLAAGGRISNTSRFFGDLLHLKPVISPTAGGARKVGVVRRRQDQLPLALARMGPSLGDGARSLILLQYSDNRRRVETEIRPVLAARFAAAEILVHPLSLTSGVHMGPGAWAVAFARLADPELPG